MGRNRKLARNQTARRIQVITCARKRRFTTSDAARATAIRISIASNWRRPLVAYRCDVCGDLHLTTATRPDQLKRARRWQAQTVEANSSATTE